MGNMPEFSISSMDKILRNAGNERVSKDASIELGAVTESLGKKIAEEAIRKAEQEGVKTVSKEHIRAAYEEIKK